MTDIQKKKAEEIIASYLFGHDYSRLLKEAAESREPNKRPDGTSAKAPPSNPSQGAAVPHP